MSFLWLWKSKKSWFAIHVTNVKNDYRCEPFLNVCCLRACLRINLFCCEKILLSQVFMKWVDAWRNDNKATSSPGLQHHFDSPPPYPLYRTLGCHHSTLNCFFLVDSAVRPLPGYSLTRLSATASFSTRLTILTQPESDTCYSPTVVLRSGSRYPHIALPLMNLLASTFTWLQQVVSHFTPTRQATQHSILSPVIL